MILALKTDGERLIFLTRIISSVSLGNTPATTPGNQALYGEWTAQPCDQSRFAWT